MSEFGGGSSEVSESTEVSETPPEETGGESSEATQEAATEEANESGGFDDAEDTEAPDSNEDTEDIDSEDDGDESQDVGFEDGEDVDNTDSQPDDAETYEEDNISDADEDQIGFDDSEETDEVDDSDIEDEDPEVDSDGNEADEDPDGSPDGDPDGDPEDDTAEDDLDADEDFDDEEDAGELEDYSDDSIDGDSEDDTVEDDQDVDDDGDIQDEEPEVDPDGNEVDEDPDGSPDGDPDGDPEDDTVKDDQDVDDDGDIQDEDPEADPDGNEADEAPDSSPDGDPDGDPEDDTVEDDLDADEDFDDEEDAGELEDYSDDSIDGDPEDDTVEDDQNVDDDADIQNEDPEVDPDGNEADEDPDGSPDGDPDGDPEDDTIEDDLDAYEDFDDEEDSGELEDYSDDSDDYENNADSNDEADDETERDQEEEELAEEKANEEAAEEAEHAVSEDANKLAEDEADPVEDENQKLLESQPENSAENNEAGDESNENEYMDDTPEEKNEPVEDIDSESEDDLNDELEDSEEYQDEGEPENYDDEKPVDPVSDTKDKQESPSDTDADDKVSKTAEESEKEDAYRTAMNNMADYLNSHNYGREDYAEYSKDPEWQKLNADLQRSLGMEVTTDVPEASTSTPESGKEVSSTELPGNCVMVNASDIDMTYAQGMNNDQFWNHHGNTKEDYMRVAEKLPDVQQALDSGKSIDELKNDPELGETVRAYYDPDNMIKVEQQPDGSYSFTDDGRHRIAAAQELGYEIPVDVTNAEKTIDSQSNTKISDNPSDGKNNLDSGDGPENPPLPPEGADGPDNPPPPPEGVDGTDSSHTSPEGEPGGPPEKEFGKEQLNVASPGDCPSWVKSSDIKDKLDSIGRPDLSAKVDEAIGKLKNGDSKASEEFVSVMREAGNELRKNEDTVDCGNALLNLVDNDEQALKVEAENGSKEYKGLIQENNKQVEGGSETPNPDDLNRKQDIGSETRENLGSFEQSKWDNLSQVEKEKAVEKLRDSIAEDLQLENKPNIAYYYKESPSDFGGYAASTNTIYINRFNMDNAGETADTIAHESRHCWQHERAENPQTAQDYRFKENFENYAKPELNFEAYYSQPVEQDAREYAAQVRDLIPLNEPKEGATQAVEGEAKPETKSENPRAPPEGEYQSKTVTELPADFEAKDVADNEVIKKVAPSIRNVDDFRSHMRSVYSDPGKTVEEKVEYEKKLFSQIPEGQKTNINAIDNPKAIRTDKESLDKGMEKGYLCIAFHDHHGLDETKPIYGIGFGKELPDVVCRRGPETGNNLTVPNEDGSIPSTDELSVPYADNPEANHYYRTDKEAYYEAIDIISSVDKDNLSDKTQKMNDLIDRMNEKYDLDNPHITEDALQKFNNAYKEFQEKNDDTKQCRKDGNCDSKYGLCGTVAPMYVDDDPSKEKLYNGGAEQYNPPCATKVFTSLGVFREMN